MRNSDKMGRMYMVAIIAIGSIVGVALVLQVVFLIVNLTLCVILRGFEEKGRKHREMQTIQSDTTQQSQNSQNTSNTGRDLKQSVGRFLNRYGYGFVRYSFIRCSHIPSYRIRNLLFRRVFLMKITKKTIIMGGCEARSPWNITADRCTIGSNCILDGRACIFFGEDVCLGSGVHIWTQEHDLHDPLFRVTEQHSKPVVIEDHCWVCSDSTILPGVKIGRGAVIASRACVIKDCEAFTVMGGVPAKKNRRKTCKSILQYWWTTFLELLLKGFE